MSDMAVSIMQTDDEKRNVLRKIINLVDPRKCLLHLKNMYLFYKNFET